MAIGCGMDFFEKSLVVGTQHWKCRARDPMGGGVYGDGKVAASSRDLGVVSTPSLRCRSGTGYLQRAAKASVAYRALPL